MFGFDETVDALVVGGRDGVGEALCDSLRRDGHRVVSTSRDTQWVKGEESTRRVLDFADDNGVSRLAAELKAEGFKPRLVLNCSGLLHDEGIGPERSLKELSVPRMRKVFEVNTFAVASLLSSFVPLMPREGRSVFASLSARVGSIGDCRLGGWHSYRASKAAQNMLLRCASVEVKRTHPKMVCVALHPGTVDTALSKPFTKRRKARVFTAEECADSLRKVIAELDPSKSGSFLAWDGSPIPW